MKRRLGMGRLSDPKKVKQTATHSNAEQYSEDSAYGTQPQDDEPESNSMEIGAEPGKAGSSGMAASSSLTDGLVTSTIRYPLSMPTGIFNTERRMRFTFYSTASWAWMQIAGSQAMWYSKSNFFEIPHNHMSFYVPYVVANDIFSSSASKVRVKNCSWKIEKMTARTFNEVNPAATNIYYQTIGTIQPSYEILQNANIQPTYRRRMWGASMSAEKTADNTSLKVQTQCESAESMPVSLPSVIWQEPGSKNMKLLGTFTDFSRHTTILEHDHKGYEHSPRFVKGWRRLVASTNPKGSDLDKHDPAPFVDGDDWSMPITKFTGSEASNQSSL